MTYPADFTAILPFLILATAAVVVMLGIAIVRHHLMSFILSLIGLVLTLLSLPLAATESPRQVTPLLVIDGYALFYMGLVLAATLVVLILSYRYFSGLERNPEEYYILLLLAALGASVLVASSHFASFFLGLEILSISLYVLIAYSYDVIHRVEAALKYLILAAASAAFLLFGMALLYAWSGTLEFARMAEAHATQGGSLLLLLGLGLLTVGIGFKLAVVPFHLWTPDVYQGAPAPVTAFVATVSKGSMLVLVLRYFTQLGFHEHPELLGGFTIVAVLSMLVGNLLAFLQSNLKRMLAYSSIAHMGYLLVPILATGDLVNQAVAFYLVAYFAATLLAFGVITVLSTVEKETEEIEAYRGLFWRRPGLALGLAVSMFSLAGIPPSAGLVGKFILAATGVQSALWLALGALIVGSVIGLFYYARVAIIVFFSSEEEEAAAPLAAGSAAVLAVLALAVIWLGVFPSSMTELIAAVVERLI
ncbi:MAG TPA: NADH-quinone oxidoreductase subunit N [Candidatus Sulfomarinibacteraceae bacterium]|nr:NADH-quinone oxidoreductase subunit N [Candidatus Sulfomarinibacteraceae bacterium]